MSISIVLAVITGVGVTYFFTCVANKGWVGFRDIVWFFKGMVEGPHWFLGGCLMLVLFIGIFIASTFWAVFFFGIILKIR